MSLSSVIKIYSDLLRLFLSDNNSITLVIHSFVFKFSFNSGRINVLVATKLYYITWISISRQYEQEKPRTHTW